MDSYSARGEMWVGKRREINRFGYGLRVVHDAVKNTLYPYRHTHTLRVFTTQTPNHTAQMRKQHTPHTIYEK
jgi:hypothetical protein